MDIVDYLKKYPNSTFSNSEVRAIVAELANLRERLEKSEKDAERYRWLRRWKGQEHEPLFTVQHEIDGIMWGCDLDSAIDAAIKAQKEGKS